MLVYGTAGVGKDTVCASVVRHPKIVADDEEENKDKGDPAGGLRLDLAAWLQGSSDAALRAQLISLFKTHFPDELVGCLNDQDKCLTRIRVWLSTHTQWLLMIEDVRSSCDALFEWIPAGTGRLLLSSQEPLHERKNNLKVTLPLKLSPLSTGQSLDIWKRMDVFRGLKSGECDDETALEECCTATRGTVFYQPPPADGEEGKAKKERRTKLLFALAQYREMHTPGLEDFLKNEVGNLPLTVQQLGHLLRRDGKPGCVKRLLDKFPRLDDLDQRGRSLQQVC